MTKFLTIVLTVLFCSASISFSAETENEEQTTTIDDDDKGSAKYGNLIDKIETAEKAYDIVNAVGTGVDAAKKLKSYDPKKALDLTKLKDKALKKALDWATKYTHSKGAFNKFMDETLKKVDKVITKASDRVDMWRTTYPSLKRYAQSLTRLTDDTKKLFCDWKPSDFLDIDRKWDRHLQENIDGYGYTFSHIRSYLKTFEPEEKKRFYQGLIPEYDDQQFRADLLASRATDQMNEIDDFRKVPKRTIEFCAASMYSLSELESKSKAPSNSDNSVSSEQSSYKRIVEELSNSSQTYEDSRELAALIEQERAKIRIQQLQIDQIQSAVELRYTNLIKRDQEVLSEQSDLVKQSLQVMCSGKRIYKSLQGQKPNKIPDKS